MYKQLMIEKIIDFLYVIRTLFTFPFLCFSAMTQGIWYILNGYIVVGWALDTMSIHDYRISENIDKIEGCYIISGGDSDDNQSEERIQ